MGLATQWTMTAAARDYRESLAIEEAIKNNPAARDAWIKRQLLLEVDHPFAADERNSAPSTAQAMVSPDAASLLGQPTSELERAGALAQ